MSIQNVSITLKREYEEITSQIKQLTDQRGRIANAIQILDGDKPLEIKTPVQNVNNSTNWSPQRRAAHSPIMKRAWDTRRANQRAKKAAKAKK